MQRAPNIMQTDSHNSIIAILRDSVELWRKRNGYSRETAVQNIVEAHLQGGFDLSSGIVFNPETRDAYDRMKVNADRVYRWLAEVTKDKNLLPAYFINSILLALPMDIRIATANSLLLQIGLCCRSVDDTDESDSAMDMLSKMLVECAEAHESVAALINGETLQELKHAHQQVTEAIEAFASAQSIIESRISKFHRPNNNS